MKMVQCKCGLIPVFQPGMQVETLLRARVARLERMEAAVAARRAAEAAVPVHWQRRAAGVALAVRSKPVLHTLAVTGLMLQIRCMAKAAAVVPSGTALQIISRHKGSHYRQSIFWP